LLLPEPDLVLSPCLQPAPEQAQERVLMLELMLAKKPEFGQLMELEPERVLRLGQMSDFGLEPERAMALVLEQVLLPMLLSNCPHSQQISFVEREPFWWPVLWEGLAWP
jgi:hypothetical protein